MSTIFTILFAATVGRALRSYALWLLEQGSSVGLLDRLLGSLTVGGALISNISLGLPQVGLLYVWIFLLLFMWALSPVGSQAVLRVASLQNATIESNISRAYMNTSEWRASMIGTGSDGYNKLIAPDSLLLASLIAPMGTKNSRRDSWGNVKIPVLSSNSTSWARASRKGLEDYSSIIGLPMGLPLSANPDGLAQTTESFISGWYWHLDCSPQQWFFPRENQDKYLQSWIKTYPTNYTYSSNNSLQPITFYQEKWDGNRTLAFCNRTSGIKVGETPPEVVACSKLPARVFGIRLADGNLWGFGKCAIRTIYYEVQIHCRANVCQAARIRRRQDANTPPPEWTVFDLIQSNGSAGLPLGQFFRNLGSAVKFQGTKDVDLTLSGFMKDPSNPLGTASLSYDTVPADQITRGLSQILNSYWLAVLGSELISGEFGDNFTAYKPYSVSANNVTTSLLDSASTILREQHIMFRCELGWLIAFTFACAVALLTSFAGLAFVMLRKGPTLAFNVTTMLRDNPFTKIPSVASHMEDDMRSKLAGRLQVRLGDVEPSRGVGHVAITSETKMQLGRLDVKRRYD